MVRSQNFNIFEISEKEKEAQKNALLLGEEDDDQENFVNDAMKKCKVHDDCEDDEHHECQLARD